MSCSVLRQFRHYFDGHISKRNFLLTMVITVWGWAVRSPLASGGKHDDDGEM